MRNGAHPAHGTLLYLGARPLPTVHGPFTLHRCQNLLTRALVLVATRGEVGGPAPLLARVHSSCITSESLGSCDCDCADQLDAALAAIARAGRGAVFYLMQEGRGAGFSAKARDRMLVQASGNRLTTFDAYARMGLVADHRRYHEVGFARGLLGIEAPLTLLTNNPEKLGSLGMDGIPIAGCEPLRRAASPFSVHYLAAKAASGHLLGDAADGAAAAALPEAVTAIAPVAVPGRDDLVGLASYLLPVAPAAADGTRAAPTWLRLHAAFDLAARTDRIVLTHGPDDHPEPLVRLQSERLDERFPLAGDGAARGHWLASVRAFAAHGAGCAALVLDETGADAPTPPDAVTLDAAAALVALRVAGRRVRPLHERAEASPTERAFAAALAAHGVAVGAPVTLPATG